MKNQNEGPASRLAGAGEKPKEDVGAKVGTAMKKAAAVKAAGNKDKASGKNKSK